MGVYQPSALVNAIRGKVGGSVFVYSKGVRVVRAIPASMSCPDSAAQQNVWATQSAVAAQWATLTTAQKDAWEEFAKEFSRRQLPHVNECGHIVSRARGPLSGWNAFAMCNNNRILSGYCAIGTYLNDAPINMPSADGIYTLTATAYPGRIEVSYTAKDPGAATPRIEIWLHSNDAEIHKQMIATALLSASGTIQIPEVRTTNGDYIVVPEGNYRIQAQVIDYYGIPSNPSEIIEVEVTETPLIYVPRDVTAEDFDILDFTADAAWHADGLDLSAIVPAGAVAVHMDILSRCTNAAEYNALRGNATTKAGNMINQFSTVATVTDETSNHIISIDSDRKLDYYVHTNAIQFGIRIIGWWL